MWPKWMILMELLGRQPSKEILAATLYIANKKSVGILPHFYVKNTFLAQKLTKLEHSKEIPEKVIEKSLKILKIKSTNVCWSFFETFCHVKQC